MDRLDAWVLSLVASGLLGAVVALVYVVTAVTARGGVVTRILGLLGSFTLLFMWTGLVIRDVRRLVMSKKEVFMGLVFLTVLAMLLA